MTLMIALLAITSLDLATVESIARPTIRRGEFVPRRRFT